MTKYSTGSSDDPDPNNESASCSLCGSTHSLTTDEIAGARVIVCQSCASEDSVTSEQSDESTDRSQGSSSSSEEDEDSTGYTITNPDSSWVKEDRPDYGNARTPYMVPDYADRFNEALESEDMSVEELSQETGVDLESVEAVSKGEALSEDVGSDEVSSISRYLDIELAEEI